MREEDLELHPIRFNAGGGPGMAHPILFNAGGAARNAHHFSLFERMVKGLRINSLHQMKQVSLPEVCMKERYISNYL